MNRTALFALNEGFISSAERRKRLGQYFSGVGLAKLLASLAQAQNAKSIIDPMGGSGDMLVGCAAIGASPKIIASIEIDPIANEICSRRNASAHCLLGNAFDKKVLKELPLKAWDLVITNPPYVRYQSLSIGAGIGHPLPKSTEIRNALEESLDVLIALDETDRKLFKALVRGYSGFADLAVPSWILSAAMVAKGGRLALVVPESWLSRDYATAINYLLFRWFRLEYIVEDEHAVWFGDAQVRTLLLVAQRVERKYSAFDWKDDDYFVAVRLNGRAADVNSPIARIPVKTGEDTESKIVSMSQEVLSSGSSKVNDFLSISRLSISQYSKNSLKSCGDHKWFRVMDDVGASNRDTCPTPLFFKVWTSHGVHRPLVPLESVGVAIGQGLRTGANEFFYSTLRSENRTDVELTVGKLGNNINIKAPFSCALPLIRRQADLPSGYVVRKTELTGRVFDFSSVALSEDIIAGGELASCCYQPMSADLADFVRAVGKLNIGSEVDPVRILDLSAIAPNIRKSNPKLRTPPRFWYMLPPFKRRHRPDIIIPRVVHETVKAWIIGDAEIVVDANFSTLAIEDDGPNTFALLALLNSTWSRVALEFSATVMGGGALKVEAIHLRRLPVPQLSEDEWERLSILGRKLAVDGEIGDIDEFILTALLGHVPTTTEVAKLTALLYEIRSRRRGARTT